DHALRRLARGHVSAQLPAPFVQVRNLRTVRRWPEKARIARGFFRNGDFKARAEMRDLGFVQFLLLVRNVAALTRLAETVALDGVSQNQRRLSFALQGALVGVVDLLGIVSAAPQLEYLFVAEMGNQVEQLRIFSEEMLAHECPVLGDEGLKLA